jgi:hypothetical protein
VAFKKPTNVVALPKPTNLVAGPKLPSIELPPKPASTAATINQPTVPIVFHQTATPAASSYNNIWDQAYADELGRLYTMKLASTAIITDTKSCPTTPFILSSPDYVQRILDRFPLNASLTSSIIQPVSANKNVQGFPNSISKPVPTDKKV